MKRLKILILIFCLTISIPLAFVVWQTYHSLSQEEHAQLRFFSETLFDEMEQTLADFVQREERRAIDEYHDTLADTAQGPRKSPLAHPPVEPYILGYLQNNPDDSFQSPLISDIENPPPEKREIVSQLKEANEIFNLKKLALSQEPEPKVPLTVDVPEDEPGESDKALFADRFFSNVQQEKQKNYLGSKSVRKEKISRRQALNISKKDSSLQRSPRNRKPAPPPHVTSSTMREQMEQVQRQEAAAESEVLSLSEEKSFQAEVAPLQSVFIRQDQFFVFRRVAIDNQIYRQGFVLQATPFLKQLAATHFDHQPMARFTGLRLLVFENGTQNEAARSGEDAAAAVITRRTFPAPFDFFSAELTAASAPPSPARKPLAIALWILGLFMLAGLVTIYQSARTVVDLSERRSQFVSSVTHELKTPLTNIRMYIEMLEQGIAATPEREQDYLGILNSESTRLSRLINNVLELAKLEKKQRHFDLRKGKLDDVLSEVRTVMAHKLNQEGFRLEIQVNQIPLFAYDREVLIQVLINLIENSVKFGQTTPEKRITITAGIRDPWVYLSVSDTGPGIPRRALKKIFNDFYRVDNKMTRTTGGTGIGLALVKKFMVAMGGRVEAVNNAGAGCTITLLLPLS